MSVLDQEGLNEMENQVIDLQLEHRNYMKEHYMVGELMDIQLWMMLGWKDEARKAILANLAPQEMLMLMRKQKEEWMAYVESLWMMIRGLAASEGRKGVSDPPTIPTQTWGNLTFLQWQRLVKKQGEDWKAHNEAMLARFGVSAGQEEGPVPMAVPTQSRGHDLEVPPLVRSDSWGDSSDNNSSSSDKEEKERRQRKHEEERRLKLQEEIQLKEDEERRRIEMNLAKEGRKEKEKGKRREAKQKRWEEKLKQKNKEDEEKEEERRREEEFRIQQERRMEEGRRMEEKRKREEERRGEEERR